MLEQFYAIQSFVLLPSPAVNVLASAPITFYHGLSNKERASRSSQHFCFSPLSSQCP